MPHSVHPPFLSARGADFVACLNFALTTPETKMVPRSAAEDEFLHRYPTLEQSDVETILNIVHEVKDPEEVEE